MVVMDFLAPKFFQHESHLELKYIYFLAFTICPFSLLACRLLIYVCVRRAQPHTSLW